MYQHMLLILMKVNHKHLATVSVNTGGGGNPTEMTENIHAKKFTSGQSVQDSLRWKLEGNLSYSNEPTLLPLSVQLTYVCNTHSNRVVVVVCFLETAMRHLWRCHCSKNVAAQDHTHFNLLSVWGVCMLSQGLYRWLEALISCDSNTLLHTITPRHHTFKHLHVDKC